MVDYHIPLFPDSTYHLFSRAIGDDKIFRDKGNFHFFLLRLQKYILPVAHIYAFCLLPNHFHLLVRIKDLTAIKAYFDVVKKEKAFTEESISDFIMERFSNLLNSYAKSFNKVYRRKGGLFIDYIRRVEITTDAQLWSTVFYIHKNPVHHGYCQPLNDWQWSSYKAYSKKTMQWIDCTEVIRCYGSLTSFLQFHAQPVDQRIVELE